LPAIDDRLPPSTVTPRPRNEKKAKAEITGRSQFSELPKPILYADDGRLPASTAGETKAGGGEVPGRSQSSELLNATFDARGEPFSDFTIRDEEGESDPPIPSEFELSDPAIPGQSEHDDQRLGVQGTAETAKRMPEKAPPPADPGGPSSRRMIKLGLVGLVVSVLVLVALWRFTH
jgi:hypothetical protein